MNKTVSISFTVPEFQSMIVDAVNACIPTRSTADENPDKILTRDEVCELLSINKSTLWKRTKSGKLKSYGQGRRVYYKRSEVLESLTPLEK